ncbi:sigma-54-dependent Fis family transcriptional regulator [Robiginitomaculum antarcticum]|uniref:sigma-54-dependent Fis family transcriptional regulator n=1 Tax=Robiginitomaculum antarcticum TaxID=437507 RepID=UPI000371B857|nr:sigma-54-dependent Fis family transcriptional regulator [Robiginitomaculum antarcticum]
MAAQILLADDDDTIRLVLSKSLTRAGYNVRSTDNPHTLLKWAEAGEGDIILSDVLMRGEEIFTHLPALRRARPNMPIIIISANNTVSTALKTGEHDVFEYVPKPFDLDDVTSAVSRAAGSLTPTRARAIKKTDSSPMIGRSAAMQPVYRAVSRYASGNLPVLIQGDVGTGKDLVARLIHEGGTRKNRPFIRETVFDNISLTLQKVSGGDIYIDEVSSLSHDQQNGLLQLMIESENIPSADRPRIISATRKDLHRLAEQENFRDDLLFRLNVAEIRIPRLSERERDTYELADAFLDNADASSNQSRRFAADALDMLYRHEWRGNVRELENLVRRLAVLYSDDVITAEMVALEFSKKIAMHPRDEDTANMEKLIREAAKRLLNKAGQPQFKDREETVFQTALQWVETPLIEEAIRLTGGNRARAAEILGIHRNTLRTKLKTLNIE